MKQADIELLEIEAKYNSLDKIDSFVDYDLLKAIESFKCKLYPATILFCAIAFEDQLSAIYDSKTNGDPSKLYVCKGRQRAIEDMNLDCLIEWAESEGIINNNQNGELTAIRYARNYFGHATPIMLRKTISRLEKGKFGDILPPKIDLPNWFLEMKEYHESITGEKVDTSKPLIGWLDSKETAINVLEVTIDFIEKSSKIQ